MSQKITTQIPIEGTKRFYFDYRLKVVCPNCKANTEIDFSVDQYLSYPKIGKVDTAYLYCEYCDQEFVFPVKIHSASMEIEFFPEEAVDA